MVARPRQFPSFKPVDSAALRLLCFPFAGGGSAIYRDWWSALSPAIEVIAYEPKGRSSRFREPAEGSIPAVLDDVELGLAEIEKQHGKKKLALFGHSMGGRMAYAFATSKRRALEHVFLSASRPPFIPSRARAHLDDAGIAAELVRLGGTPKEILESPEMLAMVLPMMRADFAIVEAQLPLDALTMPLTVFAGENDLEATPDATRRWNELAGEDFVYELFPSGHFFLVTNREEIFTRVRARLGAAL